MNRRFIRLAVLSIATGAAVFGIAASSSAASSSTAGPTPFPTFSRPAPVQPPTSVTVPTPTPTPFPTFSRPAPKPPVSSTTVTKLTCQLRQIHLGTQTVTLPLVCTDSAGHTIVLKVSR